MLIPYRKHRPRPQQDCADPPFDCWKSPDGEVTAEFRRIPGGYLARFPDMADFAITLEPLAVAATPVPGTDAATLENLYRNAVLPALGNHLGQFNLHGSAVASGEGAIAFIGLSRRGKTTLAGAFARAGFPCLSEDVLELRQSSQGYLVQPQRPLLRLFHDSASWLLGRPPGWAEGDKGELAADAQLPFAGEPAPLFAICILGPGTAPEPVMPRLGEAEALAQLIGHAFVLDVEDRQRLRAHFGRLATLAGKVPVHALDYPRRFAQLPQVVTAVIDGLRQGG